MSGNSRNKTWKKPHMAERQAEAEKRNAPWQALTSEQQIVELDKRFGKGIGAKRQRAKLAKLKK